MYAAGAPLFERAQEAGEAREDMTFDDLLRMVGGITATASWTTPSATASCRSPWTGSTHPLTRGPAGGDAGGRPPPSFLPGDRMTDGPHRLARLG